MAYLCGRIETGNINGMKSLKSRPRLLVDSSLPYLQNSLDDIADAVYLSSSEITRENILAHHAEGLLIRSVCHCNRELLEETPVRFIATATAGIDHIDQDYCKKKRIVVENAPGCNARSVAQYLFAALSEISMCEGRPVNIDLLGVVGVGHVGREVLHYAKAFGMKTIASDPPRALKEGNNSFVSFEQVLEAADIVTFHVPITQEGSHPTFHMLDAQSLSLLRKNPLLVNAARGAIVKTSDLLEALENKLLKGAIIDCWEGEPNISIELLKQAKRATPHIAGFSANGKARGSRMICKAMCHFFGLGQIGKGNSELGCSSILAKIAPPPLENPIIDASRFGDYTLEEAITHTIDLARTEEILRDKPIQFEMHRVNYRYHYEPEAYTIVGAEPRFHAALRLLGFRIG